MRDQFERELRQLRLEVFQLGERVGRMTTRAMQALLQHDTALAHEVIAEDGWADAQTVTIEDHVGRLIATQQPVAIDMRQLASALERNRVIEINPAAGVRFDPHQHQAISVVPAPQEPNTVVAVLQKGYLIADRVLRPALVTVTAAG